MKSMSAESILEQQVQSKKHVVLLNHEVCANNLHVGTLLLIYFTTLRAFCCTIYFLFYCDCHATHSTRDHAWSALCMRRKISTWETTIELICTPWLSYVRKFLHLRLDSYINAVLQKYDCRITCCLAFVTYDINPFIHFYAYQAHNMSMSRWL